RISRSRRGRLFRHQRPDRLQRERMVQVKPLFQNVALLLVLLFANEARAQQATLPIKVSPNGRYFVDQKGEPFFWLGATQWQACRDYTVDEAKTILDTSKKNGFTVIQVILLGIGDGTAPNVNGQKPWINDNPLTPNEAYFQHADRVIEAARERGIVLS